MIKTGLSRLGIFFLYLISLLPLPILYLFADLIFVILYYIVGYRRKVVQENLRNSFPEKKQEERDNIQKKYFRYLADLIVETIKSTTISAKEVIKRVECTNPELMDRYLTSGRNIVTVAGHYCNWELAGLNFTAASDKKCLIVYKPLSNRVFDEFFTKTRSRFGGILVPMKQSARKAVELRNEATVTVLVGDQTPVKHEATYFTTFMNQPTAVFLGVEKLAKLTDAVVVFYDMKRIKRGYYTFTVVPLAENTKASAPNEITEAHVRYLESMIRREPQYWLWSHRRWKFKPDDIH